GYAEGRGSAARRITTWRRGEREHARLPWAATRMGVGAAPAEAPPGAAENASTLGCRGLLRGWASGPRPPNHHRGMRGPREVCAGQDAANPGHGRGPRPHPLADAHGGLALTFRERAPTSLTVCRATVIGSNPVRREVGLPLG